jgi:hypothetical protein
LNSEAAASRMSMYGFEALNFNVDGGYLEAIVRGYKASLLTTADYNNLCQCEHLDDIKMHLGGSDYAPYLANEPSPLHTTAIVEKCTQKLVDDYNHMLTQATEPLSTFLEYITYVSPFLYCRNFSFCRCQEGKWFMSNTEYALDALQFGDDLKCWISHSRTPKGSFPC